MEQTKRRAWKPVVWIAAAVLVIAAAAAARFLFIQRGTIGELYEMPVVVSIAFGSPSDQEYRYALIDDQLDAAAEYLLSLEVRSTFWQKRYTSMDEYDLEIISLNLGSKTAEGPDDLRIVLIDPNIITIQKGNEKERAYQLSEPFDRYRFVRCFQVYESE